MEKLILKKRNYYRALSYWMEEVAWIENEL